jgi:hypothetical protein
MVPLRTHSVHPRSRSRISMLRGELSTRCREFRRPIGRRPQSAFGHRPSPRAGRIPSPQPPPPIAWTSLLGGKGGTTASDSGMKKPPWGKTRTCFLFSTSRKLSVDFFPRQPVSLGPWSSKASPSESLMDWSVPRRWCGDNNISVSYDSRRSLTERLHPRASAVLGPTDSAEP